MPAPKLLDQVRFTIHLKHYSRSTEKAYVNWIKRFILFHHKRHPKEMGKLEIRQFLTYLAMSRRISSSTQTVALSAILFLYRDVLKQELPFIEDIERAKPSRRLPVVFTRSEVETILAHLSGTHHLIASLLYGAGLRLMEAVRLRVKDIDFDRNQITVREGKGGKDRITMLPNSISPVLKEHLARVRALHGNDLRRGYGRVALPFALERKYPNADREWGWQYVFPSITISRDRRNGIERRYHTSPQSIQRVVKKAIRLAGVNRPASCHTFRHSFTTHLLENGYDIRTIQELMGHSDVRTTMVYTHVSTQGGLGVQSPLDS